MARVGRGDVAAAIEAVEHMDEATFSRVGGEVLALIARYQRGIEQRPVAPATRPGDVLAKLDARPPTEPASERSGGVAGAWARLLGDVERIVLPNLTHWQHPMFFGFFPCNASEPAVLAELMGAGLGVNGMLWSTSPAVTELEMRMMDWMAGALGLPARFMFEGEGEGAGGGVIQGTASEATLTALVCARKRALARVRARGGDADRARQGMTVYTSSQAHSSVIKACMVAGLADDAEDRRLVRLIEVDDRLALRPAALASAMARDIEAGLEPCLVVATVGTTSSLAIDPVRAIAGEIGVLPPERRPWLHVDGAHAGVMTICPELRWLGEGLDRADSLCVNPHKRLLTNFDCDLFYVADRRALVDAMSITPEYLRNVASESGGVVDYRDWHVPLGRRFRALKLWFVLTHYGVRGLASHVRAGVAMARLGEAIVRGSSALEMVLPRSLDLLCVACRRRAGEPTSACDERSRRAHAAVTAERKMLATHTVLPVPGWPGGRFTIRLAIGGTRTGEGHVRDAIALLERAAGV